MKIAVFFSALLTVAAISTDASARGGSRSGSSYGGYSGTGSNSHSYSTRSYTRRDGTYVPTHRSTVPNGTQRDNYGTSGNYNPWNGRTGTRPAWR